MFLKAERIHNGKQYLPPNTAIELSDDGEVKAIHEAYEGAAQCYEGTLCPAFVNAHCHLELSHLKGVIPKHTGLIAFLQQVMKCRNQFSETEKALARQKAFDAMYARGVIAVGDIANTTDTLSLAASSPMYIHTFVEAIGFHPEVAERNRDFSLRVWNAFHTVKSTQLSLTPHAPYSVSQPLFTLIDAFDKHSLLSIHNQECAAEDEFFKYKTGAVNQLLEGLQITTDHFVPSGKSSLQTYSAWISKSHPLLLVHNSFSQKEDVRYIIQQFPQVYFCLCPNANLYIENTLPDVPMLLQEGAVICIGTDSLASNDALDIYAELETLHQRFGIDWEQLLTWATFNGAKALQLDSIIGSIEPGKRPGIIHLANGEVQRVL